MRRLPKNDKIQLVNMVDKNTVPPPPPNSKKITSRMTRARRNRSENSVIHYKGYKTNLVLHERSTSALRGVSEQNHRI